VGAGYPHNCWSPSIGVVEAGSLLSGEARIVFGSLMPALVRSASGDFTKGPHAV
jgi:hypothetical protein